MEQLIIGFVRNSHGVAGKFRVESTSGEYEHFFALKEVTLRKDQTEKTLKVESVEGGTTAGVSNLLMKCAGIDTPEQVKSYTGWAILVQRQQACPLDKDEYYVEDLKNCTLVYKGTDGKSAKAEPIIIGAITGVLEGGAGDLLEVSFSESFDVEQHITYEKTDTINKSRVRYIPFRKEFVGKVDMKAKTIELMHLWILE